MSELDISEAQDLWQKRLSDSCTDRIASGCLNGLGKGQCNIIICPRLREAHLQIIFKFKKIKNK